MSRIGGILYFEVDGTRYAVRGNVTYAIGSNEKESVVGQDGYHGYKENPMTPFIQIDITDVLGTEVAVLQSARGTTCTMALANGKVLTLSNATQVNQLEVDAIEGQFTARFEGERGSLN